MQKALIVLAIFTITLSAGDGQKVFESAELAEINSSHPRPPHPPHPPYPPRPPHPPHPLPPPPPPYLRNVTNKARREFFAIVRNLKLTFAEQKQRIKEWGTKYGISKQVDDYDAKMTKIKQEQRKNVTKLISELSGAQQKLSAIMDDENQTLIQLHHAVRNLTAKNPQLYHVLQFANFQFIKRPHRPYEAVNSKNFWGHFGRRGRVGELLEERRVLNKFSHKIGSSADSVEFSNSILSEENRKEFAYKMLPF